MELHEIDLNLLVVFNQLLIERRVSKVADNLGVSQPAVSNSLAKLRKLFGDELFLRTPKGMEPTPYADQLAESVSYALELLETLVLQPLNEFAHHRALDCCCDHAGTESADRHAAPFIGASQFEDWAFAPGPVAAISRTLSNVPCSCSIDYDSMNSLAATPRRPGDAIQPDTRAHAYLCAQGEDGATGLTPQRRHATDVGGDVAIPALHELHGYEASPAALSAPEDQRLVPGSGPQTRR
jgi:predicted transcriptional regulator